MLVLLLMFCSLCPPDVVLLRACGLFFITILPLLFGTAPRRPPAAWLHCGGAAPGTDPPQTCCPGAPPWFAWYWWPEPEQQLHWELWDVAEWAQLAGAPGKLLLSDSGEILASTMLLKPRRMLSESKASISLAWRSSRLRIRSERSFCSDCISSSICGPHSRGQCFYQQCFMRQYALHTCICSNTHMYYIHWKYCDSKASSFVFAMHWIYFCSNKSEFHFQIFTQRCINLSGDHFSSDLNPLKQVI